MMLNYAPTIKMEYIPAGVVKCPSCSLMTCVSDKGCNTKERNLLAAENPVSRLESEAGVVKSTDLEANEDKVGEEDTKLGQLG